MHRGSGLLNNPITYANNDDLTGYINCCIKSNSCDNYYLLRPSDNCANYSTVAFGWVFGSVHLITIDNFKYTLYGLGEYINSLFSVM